MCLWSNVTFQKGSQMNRDVFEMTPIHKILIFEGGNRLPWEMQQLQLPTLIFFKNATLVTGYLSRCNPLHMPNKVFFTCFGCIASYGLKTLTYKNIWKCIMSILSCTLRMINHKISATLRKCITMKPRSFTSFIN